MTVVFESGENRLLLDRPVCLPSKKRRGKMQGGHTGPPLRRLFAMFASMHLTLTPQRVKRAITTLTPFTTK